MIVSWDQPAGQLARCQTTGREQTGVIHMNRTWEEEYSVALRVLRARFRQSDPDIIAGTLSRFWHAVVVRGYPACTAQLRWCLQRELRCDPFPGCSGWGRAHSHSGPLNSRAIKIGSARRTVRPDYWPMVTDEARWVESQVEHHGEALAVAAVKADECLRAASIQAGYHPRTLYCYLHVFRKRCRLLRRAAR